MKDCPACGWDPLMERFQSYCADHEAEGYADFAFRAISQEFLGSVHRKGYATLSDAIPSALTHVSEYAAYWKLDPAKLREAIRVEGKRRNVA